MMKTNKFYISIFMFVFLAIGFSCEDDVIEVNSTPEFQSIEETISSLPGQVFTLNAVVSDPAGIQSVNINYNDWFLDKTIVKDSLPKTYELSYSFKVPADAIENSVHTVIVTASNVGNKTTSRNVTITLDKDVAAPAINISSPSDNGTVLINSGNEIEFDINFSDNKELASFSIESSLLNVSQSLTGSSFNYTNSLNVDTAGKYAFKITATDVSGNESVRNISVNVLNELSFDQMYITDVTDPALLQSDIFGIPYTTSASTVTAEDGYVFTARYYAATPNAEVRFLPQKLSFSPYTFGADPNNTGKLVLGTDESVSPIVIPNVGYHEIKIDLRDNSYTISQYTPSDTAFNQVYIIGRGVYTTDTVSTCTNNNTGGLTCWNFASGKPFTQDANNPYLWTIDVTIKDQPNDDGVNGFILNANPSGWSPFWRLDRESDPESTVPNGGVNFVFPDSVLENDYTFIFDTHLNRLAAIKR